MRAGGLGRPAMALACVWAAAARPGGRPAVGAEILWDTWGIPHIYADSAPALAYAFGWAQMEAHGDLLLTVYGQARGRAAEYWGESHLTEDRWVRTVGGPERAGRWRAQLTPTFRAYLDAFADGINVYGRAHADRLADSVETVLPVSAADVLAHGHRILYSFFLTSQRDVTNQTRRWRGPGSNAWAIAPRRSASGRAMLLANPHLPWSDVFTWFEAHHVVDGSSLYGAALVGMPVLPIAFNERLGWTHTVNTQDGTDLYELTLAPGGYRWDGGVRAFEETTEVLRVQARDGTYRLDTLSVRRSVHGPVVAETADRAIALRLVGLDRGAGFEQWYDMGRARSLAEFEGVLGRMQVSGQNVVYADADGHILYHYGGNTPVRPAGDRAYWAGIVRGDTSATLWTTLHPYGDMPRVLDPPGGWVHNANDPPWWVTVPPPYAPVDFPPYLAPLSMALRAQRSARMLEEDSSLTFGELVAYKHATRLELADRVLDDLLPAARARGSARARRAAAVLERWDRAADAGSRGTVLFRAWWEELGRRMRGRSPFATPWSPRAPRTTPDGLAAPDTAVAALDAAADSVHRRHGALDVPWGRPYRLRRDGLDLPANGAPGPGTFRVVDYHEMDDGRSMADEGDSYVAAIEFGQPVRAMALLAYGNWSMRGSAHRTDQLPLFARKELRPVWLERAAVEQHLERRERL